MLLVGYFLKKKSSVSLNRYYISRWRRSGTLLSVMLHLLCVIRRRRTRNRKASSRGLTALSRWETSVRWSTLRGSSRRPWGYIPVFLVLEESSVKILKWVILVACSTSFVSIHISRRNKLCGDSLQNSLREWGINWRLLGLRLENYIGNVAHNVRMYDRVILICYWKMAYKLRIFWSSSRQRLHSIISHKTLFFTVTAVRISSLNNWRYS